MSKLRFIRQWLTVLIFMVGVSSIAQAQATRTWVSGVGDDLNPCSRTAPCKTFAGAISKTAINGEIDALDPGGFGAVTVTKSITLDGGTGSGWASILASGTTGITINIAVNANDPLRQVILKHLSINGTGLSGTIGTRTGINGINYVQATQVIVEDCQIMNFGTAGITVNLTASGALTVTRTTIDSNQKGIVQTVSAGTLNSAISDSVIQNNASNGLEVNSGTVNISNSLVSKNGGAGIVAQGAVGSVINADNNDVNNNIGAGIQAGTAQGTVRINNNAIHRNGTGLSNVGVMQTCGNNKNYGNTTDISGATTPVSPGSCTQ
ncbi:MAG: hypothetical protein ACREA9_22820 [Pyrinomonadaceae bacterium]